MRHPAIVSLKNSASQFSRCRRDDPRSCVWRRHGAGRALEAICNPVYQSFSRAVRTRAHLLTTVFLSAQSASPRHYLRCFSSSVLSPHQLQRKRMLRWISSSSSAKGWLNGEKIGRLKNFALPWSWNWIPSIFTGVSSRGGGDELGNLWQS